MDCTKFDREVLEEELCNILVRTEALKFGLFKLSSGKLSPYYIDLRVIPSNVEAFRRVVAMYEGFIRSEVGIESFERIAGIPTAGMPYASILAYKLGKPLLYVRKEVKEHGREKRVEGLLYPGDRVLIVDDIITTGKNCVEATGAIRSEGGVVEAAAVLIDRLEGGHERLLEVGVKLHALTTITRLADRLLRINAIDDVTYNEILQQVWR